VHTLSYCEEILRAPGLGPGARIVLLLAAAAQALIHLVPGVRTAARSVFRRLAP
jgi:hypothetical protein